MERTIAPAEAGLNRSPRYTCLRRQRNFVLPRRPNAFSGPYLDRVAHLRKDATFICAVAAQPGDADRPGAQIRATWCGVRLPAGPPRYIDGDIELTGIVEESDYVLLGLFAGVAYFAAEIDEPEKLPPAVIPPDARFEDLRMIGGQMPSQEAGVLAYARGMTYWRQRHRFCGVCGSPNQSSSAGHVMRCTNAACATDHFPRLDPAIIVLVSDGARALLGRQASWPQGRYSTIAGFVEPGESLEDAVAREVLEETGVHVLESEYHSSQPWPFPASLMVGFCATAAATEVPRADEELEDVRWFSREEHCLRRWRACRRRSQFHIA